MEDMLTKLTGCNGLELTVSRVNDLASSPIDDMNKKENKRECKYGKTKSNRIIWGIQLYIYIDRYAPA